LTVGSLSRFTVSIPSSLLEAVDEKLVGAGETRSAVVRRLLEEALRDAQEQADIERYVRGWQEQPITEEDVLWESQQAARRLAELSQG
jgi:metal-responsive CopG/Arc/MetJ family transcriptional regulator